MPEDQTPPRAQGSTGSIDRALSSALRLNRALEGNLPCIICGYDLKGVTIRGSCPECGTLVRATILYTIDPQAEEFRPLVTPRITAWAVASWAIFSLVAMLAAWWIRLADAARVATGTELSTVSAWWILIVAPAIAGVSVFGMIRPISGAKWSHSIAALIAAIAHVPLVLLLTHLHAWDIAHASPYFGWTPAMHTPDEGGREIIRLGIAVCMVTIILGIRPNARELVRRSLAMRTGRVDRQTLLAVVGAIAVASAGDGARLVSMHLGPELATVIAGVGTVLVAIGSMFTTLGAASVVIDGWRIRGVILLPAPTLHEVLGQDPGVSAAGADNLPRKEPPPSDLLPPPT